MATQLAERRADPVSIFRQTLSQPAMREQIRMALPSHIQVERFERVSLTAVQQNPDLVNPDKVERRSLFGALVRAAQDGLLPDGREGAIVPFRGKAQWMPMVAGIMKKVRNSGEIASWEAAAVYEKDTFERLLGDDQRIYHKPYEEGDPGQVVGAYSIVTFKDGTKSRDFMPRWRIDKAREQNPIGKNSLMWTKFYDEGAIKTVIRHHSKRLPMSTDVEAIFERDETMSPPGGFRPEIVAEHEPKSRLDMIEHQIAGDDVIPTSAKHDADEIEPEVIEEQAEELEAEIEQSPDEVNDEARREAEERSHNGGYTIAEEEAQDDEHPGKAIADKIIAEINSPETNAVMDVVAILNRSALDMQAMLDEDAVRIEVAADKKKNAIRAAQKATAKESAE
jgi:recombination protein RecT